LEGGGTIGHSEEHHKGFEEAAVGMEGCLPFVSRLDTYVIETPLDVKLCEVLGSAELGDELGDEGERVLVLDGDGDQREFDLETRVTTNGNMIISEMFHSCALNK